jgi:hypothetical protein
MDRQPARPSRMSDEERTLREAEELCEQGAWESKCLRDVPELYDVDEHAYRDWCNWLEDLVTMDDEEMANDLDECAYYLDAEGPDEDRFGWIEDEHGGAVFVPGHHEYDNEDAEDDSE